MNQYSLFIIGIVVLLAAPGPTNALLALGASQRGFIRSLPLLAAVLAGYGIAVWTIRLLLQPILLVYPSFGLVCKLAFAIFVVYLASKIWRASNLAGTQKDTVNAGSVFVTTLLNPKAFGFALVLIPFESPDINTYLALFALFFALTGTLWIAIGTFANHIFGPASQPVISRIAALVMLGFACTIFYLALFGLR